jgi:hypothetical protein
VVVSDAHVSGSRKLIWVRGAEIAEVEIPRINWMVFSEVKSMGEVEGYWGGSVGGMEEENYSEEMAFPRN